MRKVLGGSAAGLLSLVLLFAATEAQPFPPRPLVVAAGEAPLPWSTAPDIPTWVIDSADGTLSGRVEVRPPTPHVGEVVRVRLTGTHALGKFVAGDVQVVELRQRPQVTARCDPRPTDATSEPATTTHVEELVFHAPGRHAVFGWFDAGSCWTSNELVVEGHVDVLPAVVPANTRHAPRAQVREVDARHQGGGPGRRFEVEAIDPDGFLADARFDWGDGRSPERVLPYPVVSCERVPARAFPTSGRQSVFGTHEFVGPGRFVVRVTVTTTGCRGENPQTADAEWVLVMP